MKRVAQRLIPSLCLSAMIYFALSVLCQAASFTVNTTLDTNDVTPGNGICADAAGNCSLRAAITETNQLSLSAATRTHTITLPAGIYTLTLTGAANEINNASGDLNIRNNSNLTINGDSARTTIIQAGTIKSTNGTDGNGIDRVMRSFGTAVKLTLNNLTIRHGKAPDGIGFSNSGGGILYEVGLSTGGALNINHCAILDNAATDSGGGVNSQTSTTITNSLIAGNVSFSFNHGGGIFAGTGTTAITTINLINTTISGNAIGTGTSGGHGGGVYISDGGATTTANIINCTITGNRATATGGRGGGINAGSNAAVSPLRIRNTIVAGNLAAQGKDVGFNMVPTFSVVSGGSNLIGDASTSTGWIVSDLLNNSAANLGPLANNGGPTDTHALLAGSAALQVGDNCVLTNSCASFNLGFNLTTDQRGTGFARQVGSAVDIGAYEEAVVNSAPNINAGTLARQQGSLGVASTIATVNDAETAAGSLVVTTTSLPPGISVTGITNTNGIISATVAASCEAALGNNTVVLQVSDGALTATASLIINVTAAQAPMITTQPINLSLCPEATAVFSIAANNATGYQWRKNGVVIAGATSTTFTINNVAAADAGAYDVVVTGVCNTAVVSSVAMLTVKTPVSLATQPTAQTVCDGAPALFAVTASGTGPFSYQWRKNGVAISGATNATLSIAAASAADAGSYDVIVTGACGSPVTSATATLTVNTTTTIMAQPTTQTVCEGSSASLSVTAVGTNLSYQWRKNGVNIAGAITNSLNIASATAADAGSYDVVITGSCGTVTSNPATLTVQAATTLTAQPASLSRDAGQAASFSVSASGTNLSYQWRKNGTAISGATASSFSITSVTTTDAGNYDVIVSGACGSVSSNVATLTVNSVCSTPAVSLTAPVSGAIYPAGTPINFIGAFVDTNGQPHTATWNFASNLVNVNQAGVVNETTGAVSTSYTFTQAGVYRVTLTVTNHCGNAASASTIGADQLSALVVIYDPGAGHVTGGGWITSPLGAYAANPALTGKANFGFVSKYKNGASVPEGNTEFQFKAGNLNFKSTAYEWLVIAGARAQFKGLGTINNAGAYRFMLTAIDGQVNGGGGQDKFRIRIWDDASGGLVYDNQLNAPDDNDPTTVLGGGSIVIHKSGGNAVTSAARALYDFDGDGLSDAWNYNPTDGRWQVEQSRTHSLSVTHFGVADGVAVPADYDGDGKTDFALYRAADGAWRIWQSTTGTMREDQFGASCKLVFAADFDGDSRADLAVRDALGHWQVRLSFDGAVLHFKLGTDSDLPFIADFDGDGLADAASLNPHAGLWQMRLSASGKVVEQVWLFEQAADVQPLAADFDGDGRSELAVWSMQSAQISYRDPHNGQTHQVKLPEGMKAPLSVGDYDGDGRTDCLIWRTGQQTWQKLFTKQRAEQR